MGVADFPEPPGTCSIFVRKTNNTLEVVAWVDDERSRLVEVIIDVLPTDDQERIRTRNEEQTNTISFQVQAPSSPQVQITARYGAGQYDTLSAFVQGEFDSAGVFHREEHVALPDGCSVQANVAIPSQIPSQCRIPGQPPQS